METYERFEQEWEKWAGVENVVACSSGTAALHLALEAMQLPLGSEVIVPDFTMVACPRAVTLAGLVPVFVDCTADLLMDYMLVERLLEQDEGKTIRAIMPVHVYGRKYPVDCGRQCEDVRVIEDLAEAHGVKPHPDTDAACWSFYKNKIIAGEEGGAVAFKDPEHAARARQLRSMGFTAAHDFMHVPRGHNYRMSNAHATLILDSLERVGADHRNGLGTLSSRRHVEARWGEACPVEWRMPPRDAPWVYDLRIPGMTSEQQGRVVGALQEVGVAARHAFKPCSRQEEYRQCRMAARDLITGTAASLAAREVIYLPLTGGRGDGYNCEGVFYLIRRTLDPF